MTSTETTTDPLKGTPSRTPTVRRVGDVVFKTLSTTSGALILAILAAVFFFLLIQGLPAIVSPVNYEGNTDSFRAAHDGFAGYIMPLVFGTVWSSLLAMILAIPVGVSVALFISHFSPRRMQGLFGFVIDMLAAVPSVVFGLWGILVFAPIAGPLYEWLGEYLSWIPLFSGTPLASGRNILTAVIVLSIMILPIITSLSREIFLQTPRLHEEASLALGATRWEMVRQSVFPYARSGLFASAVLALGRALGETMAVAMVLSGTGIVTFQLLTSQNPQTIAGQIANQYPEASGMNSATLIAGGLVLFAITLLVNSIGRWIIGRAQK